MVDNQYISRESAMRKHAHDRNITPELLNAIFDELLNANATELGSLSPLHALERAERGAWENVFPGEPFPDAHEITEKPLLSESVLQTLSDLPQQRGVSTKCDENPKDESTIATQAIHSGNAIEVDPLSSAPAPVDSHSKALSAIAAALEAVKRSTPSYEIAKTSPEIAKTSPNQNMAVRAWSASQISSAFPFTSRLMDAPCHRSTSKHDCSKPSKSTEKQTPRKRCASIAVGSSQSAHGSTPVSSTQKLYTSIESEKLMESKANRSGTRRAFFVFLGTARMVAKKIFPACSKPVQMWVADNLTWQQFYTHLDQQILPFAMPNCTAANGSLSSHQDCLRIHTSSKYFEDLLHCVWAAMESKHAREVELAVSQHRKMAKTGREKPTGLKLVGLSRRARNPGEPGSYPAQQDIAEPRPARTGSNAHPILGRFPLMSSAPSTIVPATSGGAIAEGKPPAKLLNVLAEIRRRVSILGPSVILQDSEVTICDSGTVQQVVRCFRSENAKTITAIGDAMKCDLLHKLMPNGDLFLWSKPFPLAGAEDVERAHSFLVEFVIRVVQKGGMEPSTVWSEIQRAKQSGSNSACSIGNVYGTASNDAVQKVDPDAPRPPSRVVLGGIPRVAMDSTLGSQLDTIQRVLSGPSKAARRRSVLCVPGELVPSSLGMSDEADYKNRSGMQKGNSNQIFSAGPRDCIPEVALGAEALVASKLPSVAAGRMESKEGKGKLSMPRLSFADDQACISDVTLGPEAHDDTKLPCLEEEEEKGQTKRKAYDLEGSHLGTSEAEGHGRAKKAKMVGGLPGDVVEHLES